MAPAQLPAGDDVGVLEHMREALSFPRRTRPHEPLARALLDHFELGHAVEFWAHRGRSFSYSIGSQEFFALSGPQQAIDQRALREARGRVLDVGAGAGRHALELQDGGCDVLAIDVSATCVDIMRRRGVRQAEVQDIHSALQGPFDTILFLMQSIGIAGSFAGLEVLLGRLAEILAPGGQILLDSSELSLVEEDEPVLDGGIEVHFEYRNLRGRRFPWLYIDESDMLELCRARGWHCEILERVEDTGEYLARLQLLAAAASSPRGGRSDGHVRSHRPE